MLKRVLSIFIAVVLFTTAIVVFPENNVAKGVTATSDETWEGSVHALRAGDYSSKDIHGLQQHQNDYDYPDTFHITTFNSCDYAKDPETNNPLYMESSDSGTNISSNCDFTPNELINLATYDGTNVTTANPNDNHKQGDDNNDERNGYGYSYYSQCVADRTSNFNFRMRVFNYDGVNITDYSYLRFQICAQNVQFDDTTDNVYFRVQLYDNTDTSANSKAFAEFDCTGTFRENAVYDYLLDLTKYNYTKTVKRIEFHFQTIQLKNTSQVGKVWYDNIRFLKNAVHTKTFASEVSESKSKVFSECETNSKVKDMGGSSLLKIGTTAQSHYSGNGCVSITSQTTTATTAWTQVALQPDDSNYTFKLTDFQYIRFYLHFASDLVNDGKIQFNKSSSDQTKINWPEDCELKEGESRYPFTIYFSHDSEYSGDNATNSSSIGMIRGNLKVTQIASGSLGAGWWVCIADLSSVKPYWESFDTNKAIKSISIQLGNLTYPTTSNEKDKAIHIDKVEFVKYEYSDSSKYYYPAGHYQVLHGFEGHANAVHNTTDVLNEDGFRRVMRYEDLLSSIEYNSAPGDWLKRDEASGNTYVKNDTGSIGGKRRDDVTQGMYSSWIRAKAGDYSGPEEEGALQIAYNFPDRRSRDLSKFTHFSIDLTIRPQNETVNNTQKVPPGLTGSNETFRLRLRSNRTNDDHFDITFTLLRKSGTTKFYSSTDGVDIFPLDGFIPGVDGAYTASGCMRITFTLDAILKNATDNFNITSVDQIRFFWLKSIDGRTSDMYTTDRADFFIDNLMAFTPDMNLTVKTEGIDRTTDLNQSFVYRVQGTDDVTAHVDFNFDLSVNNTTNSSGEYIDSYETIPNLPLNSYKITQSDWAWRYDNPVVQTIPQVMSTKNYSTTNAYSYKYIMDNKLLSNTIVFTPTNKKTKWLSDERRSRYFANRP